MALKYFRASPLPNPPREWDPQYMRQFIRVLENYFSQLDSKTPNFAQSYTADTFEGIAATEQMTTARKTALNAQLGWVVFDTDLDKLCVYTSSGWQTITST